MGAAKAAGQPPPAASGAGTSRSGRVAAAAGNLLLTLAAIGGAICILAVLAAWIFKITLIMFSTGSMSPTIPAGSVAVVRQIPAAEVNIGDVVTVDRPGRLPVTHRVRAVEPGQGAARILTLRGDANAADDAETYPVTSVRLVQFSIPGVAGVIVALSNPFVLGGITILLAGLVLWAFWPRAARSGPATESPAEPAGDPTDDSTGDGGGIRLGGTSASLAAVVLVGLGGLLITARPANASAGIQERVISGSVITLITVGDEAAMTNLQPGQPVRWQVGVSSDPPEPGRIDLTVMVSGPLASTPGGLQLSVSSCAERWRAGHCPTSMSPVLPAAPAAGYLGAAKPAGSMPAGEQRWLQVEAWLPADAAGTKAGTARVRIAATGFGDTVVSAPGGGELPNTGLGGGVRAALLAGALGLIVGLSLLGVAQRRGRRVVR
ncbi:signal peptidase I [Nakamurella lactea]|uniref:signal peptidase I n=1 Tax=Nakamurella lactea TaxID=459515 RepID=UPI00040DFF38|nr:signal peptidase I [Nakamurella lactea]